MTFFPLKRLSRYAGQVRFALHLGQGAASRAASPSSSRAERDARGAVEGGGSCDLFRAATSSRYAGQVGFARDLGQGAASRAASESSCRAQREVRVAVEDGGCCDLFPAATSSRYAEQVACTSGKAPLRARTSTSSGCAWREGLMTRSRMEGAVTFFPLQRLVDMQNKPDFLRHVRIVPPGARGLTASLRA